MDSAELEKVDGAWKTFIGQTSPQSALQLLRYLKTTLPFRGDRFDKLVDTRGHESKWEKTQLFAYPWGSSNILFNCPGVDFNKLQTFITVFSPFIKVEKHHVSSEWISNKGYHHVDKLVECSLDAPDASPFCQYLTQWVDPQVQYEIEPPQKIALSEAYKWWLLTITCENSHETDPRLEIPRLNEYLLSAEIPPLMRERVQKNLQTTDLQPKDLGEVIALYRIGLCYPGSTNCRETHSICIHPQIREIVLRKCEESGINSENILESIQTDWIAYSTEVSDRFKKRSDALSTLLAVLEDNETTEIRNAQINKDMRRILMREGLITEIHPGVFTLSDGVNIAQVKMQFDGIEKEKKLEMGRWIQRSILMCSETTDTHTTEITVTHTTPTEKNPVPPKGNGSSNLDIGNSDPDEGILVGFECGTGEEVRIKPAHLFVSGLPGEAGKTTTLEALIHRSGLSAISFVTKPGEKCFKSEEYSTIKPFFPTQITWKTMEGLFSVLLDESMKDLRYKLIKMCESEEGKSEETLDNLSKKIKEELKKQDLPKVEEKSLTLIDAYFKELFDQTKNFEFSKELVLEKNVNIMDLSELNEGIQDYVITMVIDEILNNKKGIIVLIPEAWKFIPQKKKTPAKHPIEKLARQGVVNNNYVWIDSQDIANVDKAILKNVSIWILGKQTETNEVKHTIDQIPSNASHKPKKEHIMNLQSGEFFVIHRNGVKKTYVLPKDMDEKEGQARAVAKDKFN